MGIFIVSIFLLLTSFTLLSFSRGRWSENVSAILGVGSVAISVLATTYISIEFFDNNQKPLSLPLWTWISVGNDFNISFGLLLDGLSLIMLYVITGVGFLIHIFASWYMRGTEGYSRFFAYNNLFIANMLIVVLADNLLMMYLGWELVGFCSYLLIGFYYNNADNIAAAAKAFIITRIGSISLVFALFILYNELGTLNFHEITETAPKYFKMGDNLIWWVTIMLLGGAIGKSAQLPLHTWLADAMVGPTPVSALIHAATMVTVGVYLIARTHILFLMSPDILNLVGIIGSITLLLAGFAAMVQTDIKRILAYSTMGQIGYMFLALGAQAWNAAILHLMTHAFFKALLFLSAGYLILVCQNERDIFKMGGLWKDIPLVYICFLTGSAALTALPMLTAGFFSKEKILAGAIVTGHINLMIIGLIGTFITSIYTFRMIFIVFHSRKKVRIQKINGITCYIPLIILLIISIFAGTAKLPLYRVFPNTDELDHNLALILKIASSTISITGITIAAYLWLGKRLLVNLIVNSYIGQILHICCYNAFGFDLLYEKIFLRPFLNIKNLLKRDLMNLIMNTSVVFFTFLSKILLFSENGYLRWYITSISIGAVVMLITMMSLC